MDYFDVDLADEIGISGDDLNRRLRERRLGYGPPSSDWADSDKEIRCIHPNQVVTRAALSNREIHVHADPAYFNPDNMLPAGIRIVK